MTTQNKNTVLRGYFATTGLTPIKQRLNLMAVNAMRFRADLWAVYHASQPFSFTTNNNQLLDDCMAFKTLIDDSANDVYNMLRSRFIAESINRTLWSRAEAISDAAFDMYQHIYTVFSDDSTAAQRSEALLKAIACFNTVIGAEPIQICIHDRRLVNLLAKVGA